MDENMECQLSDRDRRLDDFLLQKLAEPDAEAFEIHLFGCPGCLQELRLREQMIKLIKEERITLTAEAAKQPLPEPEPSLITAIVEFFRLRPNARIYAGAAAVLFIAFLVAQILRKQESAEIYRANFVESPYLEEVMKQTYLSAAISVSILSPQIGQNFEDDVLFRWDIRKDENEFNGPFDLKIMNNKEAPVDSAIVDGSDYHLKKKFDPGLYYWTLEHQKETLFLGKFFIKQSAR